MRRRRTTLAAFAAVIAGCATGNWQPDPGIRPVELPDDKLGYLIGIDGYEIASNKEGEERATDHCKRTTGKRGYRIEKKYSHDKIIPGFTDYTAMKARTVEIWLIECNAPASD